MFEAVNYHNPAALAHGNRIIDSNERIQQAIDKVKEGVAHGDWLDARFALILKDGVPYICTQGRKKSEETKGLFA